MSGQEPIGVAVVGLGFMGATHVRAFRSAGRDGFPGRLLAVCDSRPDRLLGHGGTAGNIDTGTASERLFDPAEVTGYTDIDELLADDRVDLVSVCTPTPTHVDFGTRVLEAGKDLLLEKPVALCVEDIGRLVDVTRACGRVCMPAMCMRFWPGWSWLKEQIQEGALGAVRSATFQRLGSLPSWSRDFYGDAERSGGALVDLHIHDADLVRWLFGEPESVASTGSLNHLTTLYRFRDGPAHVFAEGGWGHDPAFPFRMRFVVAFEGATADFDLSRDRPLMLARDGAYEPVDLPPGDGYDGEVRHLLTCLADGRAPEVTLGDALAVTRILDAERRSLQSGRSEVP